MLARCRSRATVPLMLLILLALICLFLARADAAALDQATSFEPAQQSARAGGAHIALSQSDLYVLNSHLLFLDPSAGERAPRAFGPSPVGWAE
jgi:hypothetical protein